MQEKIATPLGEITICIDNEEIQYNPQIGCALDILCPDIKGRYQVEVCFIPDGKEHRISCTTPNSNDVKGYAESGERLECIGLYKKRYKLSIGIECESGYLSDGKRFSDEYDFDVEYLENGIECLVLPETKTEEYIFGIAWIDEVDINDMSDEMNARDIQTWFGADPTLALK